MTEQQLPEEVLAQLIKANNIEGIKKLFDEFADLDPNFQITEEPEPAKPVSNIFYLNLHYIQIAVMIF